MRTPPILFCIVSLLVSSGPARALAAEDEDPESQEIVVVATRSRQLVRDQPTRVEVVPEEELEESQTVAPGNLTNLLNELAGARISASDSGLGGTSLSLRGLPGRHAQILFDGLPLAGPQSDSFSLLQTPPIDLRRVEVVKGVASALYGGSAVAGVLNLVSRAPDGESELLLNQTSVGGSDANLFLAHQSTGSFGQTLTAGLSYQDRKDFDDDSWTEQPGYLRASLRPRLYWNDAEGRTLFATAGFTAEERTGGTMPGDVLPSGSAFPESLETRRYDIGAVGHAKFDDGAEIHGKLSALGVRREREFGAILEDDSETNIAGEFSWQRKSGDHDWTIGGSLEYRKLEAPEISGASFTYTDPAVFAQDEFAPTKWLSLAVSARVDAHSDFGIFLSPRLSALIRLAPEWSLRTSLGSGFAPVTPFIEQVQELALSVLLPPSGLQAERAKSAAVDLKWARRPFEVNLSAFASNVDHFLTAEAASEPERVQLYNSTEPFRVRGAELLMGWSPGEAHILANATYLDASEQSTPGTRRPAELTPRFTAEIAAIFEDEERGRIGFEISYTGEQSLHDDPYRTRTPSYLELNALAELHVGRIAVFLNALNVTDRRQGDFSPILRPASSPGLGGNPATDAWMSLVGRVFNLGIRTEL